MLVSESPVFRKMLVSPMPPPTRMYKETVTSNIRNRIRQRNRCGSKTESHRENPINARLEVISHTRIAFEEIIPKCCRPSRINVRNSDLHRSQLLSTTCMRRISLHEIATLRLRTPCDNIDIVNNSLCWQNVRKCKREKQR